MSPIRSRRVISLDRRSFLKGSGVACTLPYLEAMSPSPKSERREMPRRACFVYFPNGCSLPAEDDKKYAHWRWFPSGEGEDFKFTRVLEPLEPFKKKLAVYSGLSHPRSRELLGHLAGDTWLTGGDLRGGHYKNNMSVDQVLAMEFKKHTRIPSFVLSTDGGVGYKSRVSTLSFDSKGQPIPSEHNHRRIFERYFAPNGNQSSADRRRELHRGKKIVDLVHEESQRLSKQLGRQDRSKLDEFLSSLNALEEQVKRNEAWLDTPLKPFSTEGLELNPNPKLDPTAYVRTTYDLMLLGLQTDITRVMTYMLAREDGMGFGDSWPRLVTDVKKGHHTISHDAHEGHFDEWGPYDRWYAEQFAYFLKRLETTSDEFGPLLDNTMVLYGSSCTTTHNARNYPMLLAGGGKLGVKQGQFRRYSRSTTIEAQNNSLTGASLKKITRRRGQDDLPCSNLYLSMLRALGVQADRFSDSTGPLEGFMA